MFRRILSWDMDSSGEQLTMDFFAAHWPSSATQDFEHGFNNSSVRWVDHGLTVNLLQFGPKRL